MLCPTTIRLLAFGALALVVIIGVVLLATRRPILGLVIGLCVLAVAGLAALPVFWLSARSQVARVPASRAVLPDPSRAPQALVVTDGGECVIAVRVPDVLLLDEESGRPLDEFPVELDEVPFQTGWPETVRELADSLKQLARSQQTDHESWRPLRRLSEDRFDKLASNLLRPEWAVLVRDARAAAADADESPKLRMPEVRFQRDKILTTLADLDTDPLKRAARPRSVVLSVLVVSGLLIVAYSLLQAGLRRAATTRPHPPRHHG